MIVPITQQIAKQVSSAFTATLHGAALGQATSLPFISHNLSAITHSAQQETFLALVVGGTYYRAALVQNQQGKPKIVSQSTGPLPTFTDASVFLPFIAARIPTGIGHVSLNFAYGMEPVYKQGNLDGILTKGGKEHGLTDMLGKPVGETIESYLRQKTGQKVSVSVANDTVCLLLSGLSHYAPKHLVAGIVGTGLNFAVFLDEHTAVNLESGLFSDFPVSGAATIVDTLSHSPGKALYEKEVSGAYLPKLYAVLAEQSGIFVDPVMTAADVSAIAYDDNHPGSATAKAVIERSAALVACQLVGIANWYGRDITVVMEGGVYWNAWRYQYLVAKWINLLQQSPITTQQPAISNYQSATTSQQSAITNQQLPINNHQSAINPLYAISIVRIPDCDLMGAIHLVL